MVEARYPLPWCLGFESTLVNVSFWQLQVFLDYPPGCVCVGEGWGIWEIGDMVAQLLVRGIWDPKHHSWSPGRCAYVVLHLLRLKSQFITILLFGIYDGFPWGDMKNIFQNHVYF